MILPRLGFTASTPIASASNFLFTVPAGEKKKDLRLGTDRILSDPAKADGGRSCT